MRGTLLFVTLAIGAHLVHGRGGVIEEVNSKKRAKAEWWRPWRRRKQPGSTAATATCAADFSTASAAAWLEALDASPGSVAAHNREGLLLLLRGGAVEKAAASFAQAWRHPGPVTLAQRLATAKNMWWVQYMAEDSGRSELREDRIDEAEEEIYAAWQELAKVHVPSDAPSDATPSMFDLPLALRICRDPLMTRDAGASGPREAPPWRARYLDLLKRSVANYLYRPQSAAHEQPWDLAQSATGVVDMSVPPEGHTVMRAAALTHLQLLADDVVARGVAGDVLQAGVFRGGAGVLLRATLDAAPEPRTLWLADSFAGIPLPRTEVGRAVDESAAWGERYVASDDSVRDVFRRYGYAIHAEARGGGGTRLLKGLFNETLRGAPMAALALVHIDADSYDSVLDVLRATYERVASGGYVVIDDIYLRGVRTAVFEFRKAHGIDAPLLPVPSDRIATCTPDLSSPGSAWAPIVTPLSAAYWMKVSDG